MSILYLDHCQCCEPFPPGRHAFTIAFIPTAAHSAVATGVKNFPERLARLYQSVPQGNFPDPQDNSLKASVSDVEYIDAALTIL